MLRNPQAMFNQIFIISMHTFTPKHSGDKSIHTFGFQHTKLTTAVPLFFLAKVTNIMR